MINNIFNQFDPHSSILNPFILTAPFLFIILSPNLNPNLNLTIFSNSINTFLNENISNIILNNNNINNSILINILISVSLLNLISLTPYSWSSTSHIALNLSLICILWTPILMITMAHNNNSFLTHLIPQNTPSILIPFIFLIEIISFLIRPITLTIRLTANIIAGHIIISLNSNLILSSPLIYTLPSAALALLSIIEILVAILQAYIIITLLSIFISEI